MNERAPRDTSSRRPPDGGFAILVTIIVLLVVSVLGATVITLGRLDQAVAANYRSSTAALYLAESAHEMTLVDLRADRADDPDDNWFTRWLDTSGGLQPVDPFPDVAGEEINGHVLSHVSVSPDPHPGTPYAVGNPQPLGVGAYSRIIWLPPRVTASGSGKYQVSIRTRATGTDDRFGAEANVSVDADLLVDVTDVSGWGQALMIGQGRGGAYLRGDVMVAGSVHLAGDPWVVPTLPLADFSSSTVQNNYAGIDDASGLGPLASKLPALEEGEYGGETVQTLDASFRLKSGSVSLGGTGDGSLGSPDEPGNAVKETLDGFYSDGDLVDPDGDVHADATAPYDATGDFFDLDDPYTDPETGGSYGSYHAYLMETAFKPLAGNLTIRCDTPSFAHTDAAGEAALAWDQDTRTLTIAGTIAILGDVEMGENQGCGGAPAIESIGYAGTGTLYATSNVELHTDLAPVGRFLEDGPDLDDEVDGNLGIIAGDEVELAGHPRDGDIRVIASLYAGKQVHAGANVNVAGGIMTNYLRVRQNRTLRIWQVPALSTGVAGAMPAGGDFSIGELSLGQWYQHR